MSGVRQFALGIVAAGAVTCTFVQPAYCLHPFARLAFQRGGRGRGVPRAQRPASEPPPIPEDATDFRPRHALHGPGPHAGDWLRRYKNLPPDQQQKALQNDPEFRQLPPEKQEQLRQRLQKFSSLPPDKQQQILDRMETWEHLTPQQQQRARTLFERLRTMPDDRRQSLMNAYHGLRDLPPDAQQKALQSDQMRSDFSDAERDTLKGFLDLGVGPGARRDNSGNQPQAPQ